MPIEDEIEAKEAEFGEEEIHEVDEEIHEDMEQIKSFFASNDEDE